MSFNSDFCKSCCISSSIYFFQPHLNAPSSLRLMMKLGVCVLSSLGPLVRSGFVAQGHHSYTSHGVVLQCAVRHIEFKSFIGQTSPPYCHCHTNAIQTCPHTPSCPWPTQLISLLGPGATRNKYSRINKVFSLFIQKRQERLYSRLKRNN